MKKLVSSSHLDVLVGGCIPLVHGGLFYGFAPRLSLHVVVLMSMMAYICFPIVRSFWILFIVFVGCIGSICVREVICWEHGWVICK